MFIGSLIISATILLVWADWVQYDERRSGQIALRDHQAALGMAFGLFTAATVIAIIQLF